MVLGSEGDIADPVMVSADVSFGISTKSIDKSGINRDTRVNAIFERSSPGSFRRSCGLVFTSARQPRPE